MNWTKADQQWLDKMMASPEIKEIEAKYGPLDKLVVDPKHNELLEDSPDPIEPVDPANMADPRNNELLGEPDAEDQS